MSLSDKYKEKVVDPWSGLPVSELANVMSSHNAMNGQTLQEYVKMISAQQQGVPGSFGGQSQSTAGVASSVKRDGKWMASQIEGRVARLKGLITTLEHIQAACNVGGLDDPHAINAVEAMIRHATTDYLRNILP